MNLKQGRTAGSITYFRTRQNSEAVTIKYDCSNTMRSAFRSFVFLMIPVIKGDYFPNSLKHLTLLVVGLERGPLSLVNTIEELTN
jgi:hypothetical protein